MNHFSKGFTIVELLVVVVILVLLSTVVLTDFSFMKKQSDADITYEGLLSVMRLAKSRAVASEGNSRWGVYIDTSVSPVKYTLYKGSTYATRITSADQKYYFSKGVTKSFPVPPFGQANVDIAFEKVTGKLVTATGFIFLPLSSPIHNLGLDQYYFIIAAPAGKSEFDPFKAMSIDTDGTIASNFTIATDTLNLVQDSRHLVFEYSRPININNESVTFNYNNSEVVRTYPLLAYASYANSVPDKADVLDTSVVGGSAQSVRFRIYVLNNYPSNQGGSVSILAVYRDRRYNNQPVTISLSGDNTGTLIQYSADGLTTTSTTSYINPAISNSNYRY